MKPHLPLRLCRAVFSCLATASCLTLGSGIAWAEEQASVILSEQETLTIDYADADTLLHVGGILQLLGDTQLDLSNCGEGDGKTYTLLTGVSDVLNAEGNELLLDSSNNTISHYFDTTQPGTGFWADATLSLSEDGTLQLVRHNETLKVAQTITTRQTASLVFSYYEGISFEDITGSSSGGAIDGDYYSTIALSGNGSVTFSGNTASSSGGAIQGYYSTIELRGNGSVTFSGNIGGAIYGSDGTIELRGNGSVTFSGNIGGAIHGDEIILRDNGSVTFDGNAVSTIGGAIDGGTVTLSNNKSVTFRGNSASSSYKALGGAIYTEDSMCIVGNEEVTFAQNLEKNGSTYRLRSLYLSGGSGDKLLLSAGVGQSINFYDSVYMGAGGSIVVFNADYQDANGVTQQANGTILFSGASTEEDLRNAKGGVAGTEAEILNSRTSVIKGTATLYAGTLRVENAAVLKLNVGLTVAAGSEATVEIKDAELSVGSYALSMVSGSSLVLAEEAKLTSTELTITTGATLAVRGAVSTEPLTEKVAALTLSKETMAGFDASHAVNTGSVSAGNTAMPVAFPRGQHRTGNITRVCNRCSSNST